MKPLLVLILAAALLLTVVYGAAATGALTDRPLATFGVLLIGVGLVRHHRERPSPARAAAPARRKHR